MQITGESFAEQITAWGYPCSFVSSSKAPQVITYKFKLDNLLQLNKVKKLCEPLTAWAGGLRVECDTNAGGFSLIVTREEREFPSFWSVNEKLEGLPDGSFSFGLDQKNQPLIFNIEKCPHILIAGCTGSGKSVFLNSLISQLCLNSKHTKLILIDPKQVEFSQFENAPSLFNPIVTSTEQAIAQLNQLCDIMDDRYAKLKKQGLRDNSKNTFNKIVCIIDEIADLMLTSRKDVEAPIVRIAQKGRACGIHLVLATQRPTVNVVTGLIKANIPTRVVFAVSSVRDSMVMLDNKGAEDLLGKGDCLVKLPDRIEEIRIQSPNITTEDIAQIFENCPPRKWKKQIKPKTNKKTFWERLKGIFEAKE